MVLSLPGVPDTCRLSAGNKDLNPGGIQALEKAREESFVPCILRVDDFQVCSLLSFLRAPRQGLGQAFAGKPKLKLWLLLSRKHPYIKLQ